MTISTAVNRPRAPAALAVGLTLCLVGFAGCIEFFSPAGLAYASFAEAAAAAGPIFGPDEGAESDLRLKLLAPAVAIHDDKAPHVELGTHELMVLIYREGAHGGTHTDGHPVADSDEQNSQATVPAGATPVEDATVTLRTWMPAHSHGASPERDPSFEEYGVYVGQTTFSMPGLWELQLAVSDGDESVPFTLTLRASDDDDAMEHDDTEHAKHNDTRPAEDNATTPDDEAPADGPSDEETTEDPDGNETSGNETTGNETGETEDLAPIVDQWNGTADGIDYSESTTYTTTADGMVFNLTWQVTDNAHFTILNLTVLDAEGNSLGTTDAGLPGIGLTAPGQDTAILQVTAPAAGEYTLLVQGIALQAAPWGVNVEIQFPEPA